jgi:gliding motility-associated-like protein
MKKFLEYFMNLICSLLILFSAYFSTVSAQTVIDCPQIPTYDFFQRDCFIKCEQPYGEIRLPQGSVDGLNSMRNLSISIPTNRPTWALAIAHSWNYNRNVIKKVDYPKISYWLAITGHEIGMTCDCGAEYIPGHIPWVDAVNSGGTTWPIECAATRNNKGDGCFQMEEGNGWGSLNQVYPDRFPCSSFNDMISNDNFETAALSMAYRNTYNHFLIDYSWGMDIWPLIENTVDKYAYERILATGWNSWAGGLHQNLTARYPASFPYDLTTPAGRAGALAEDFWDLTGNVGYYPDVIGWVCAVLDSNIQVGTQYHGLPTIHAAHATPVGTQSHVHLDNYNEDISWQTVSDYMDTIFGFYHEFNTPALKAPIVANVQAVFVAKAGGIGAVIPFKNIGPVIDEIILNFPNENPLMTIIHDDGYPQGPLGNQTSKCLGNYAPASHIEKKGITTDTICAGQSMILEAMIDGGDGPNLIYDWIVDGVATGVDAKEYVFTGSALGAHVFSVNVCNPQLGGCADACCEISVFVKQCTACTLSATSTSTDTPCENMWSGSIDLTVLGSTSYTVAYDGPKVGNVTGAGGSHTIANLPDGVYNIILTDVADPTCIFYLTETVGFVTAMNDKLTASIQTLNACDAVLQTELTQDKCECEWKVGFNTSYGAWGRSSAVEITTSGGSNLVLKGDVALNPSPDVITTFNLCSGETINAEVSLRKASGGCTNGAVTTPEHPITLWIIDPTGVEVLRVTVPLSSISQTANAFAFNYNVSCPYTPDPYTYAWNPGGLVGSPVNVSSNIIENVEYTVTATNTNNPQCTLSDTVMVPFTCTTNCVSPTSAISSTGTAFCEGDSLPLTVALTGTQPWNIKVNNGSTTGMHTGITSSPYTFYVQSGGTYVVDSIYDANACPDVGDGSSVVVTMNSISKPTLGADTSICLTDAAVLFDAGVGYASYLWSPGGATSQTKTSTVEGEYIVSVVDVNTCTSADTINFNLDTILPVNLGLDAQICAGGNVTLDAGAGYLNYLWNPGMELSQTINVTTGGNYIVGVVDANGCVDTDTISVAVVALTVNLGNDTTICFEADLTLNAGAGFTTYSWTGGTTDPALLLDGSIAGTTKYVVVVGDNSGCTATDSVNITVNNQLTIDLGADTVFICPGSNIMINPIFQGGDGSFNFAWQDGSTGLSYSTNIEEQVKVTITDGISCSATDSVFVKENSSLVVDLRDTTICPGDSLTLNTGYDAVNYNITWNTSESSQFINVKASGVYGVVVDDGSGCTGSDSMLLTLYVAPLVDLGNDTTICAGSLVAVNAGLGFTSYLWSDATTGAMVSVGQGNYSVIATDNNGCIAKDTVAVREVATPSPNELVDLNSCVGTAKSFSVSGFDNGNGPFNYLWQDGTTANNTTINSGVLGNHQVWAEVTDAYGCSGRDSAVLVLSAGLQVSLKDTAICSGDSLSLNAGYDTVNYNFTWNTSENSQFINVKASGVYGVVVDDGSGCTGGDSMLLTLHVAPLVDFGNDTTICAGSSVTISAGLGFTSYLWSDATTASSVSAGQGTYNVIATDMNGCVVKDTVVVTAVSAPNPQELVDLSACVGTAKSFSASGFNNGNGPFNYLWQDGTTADNITINSSTLGTQQIWVEVTDVYKCAGRDSALLTISSGLQVNLEGDSVLNLCEGTSISLASNLTSLSAYNYSWTPKGETTPSIDILTGSDSSTVYTLTVDDGTGCQGTDSLVITLKEKVKVSLGSDTSICAGSQHILDPGPNYNSYLWSTGENTRAINVFSTGIYSVQVDDNSGCEGLDTVYISFVAPPTSLLDQDLALITYCFEYEKEIKLTAGSQGVNQYLWSPSGSVANEITVDSSGLYSVTITSDDCVVKDSLEITTFCYPSLYIPNSFSPNSDGLNDNFEVRGNVESYEINIFNRWGELIFIGDDINTSWDGNYKNTDAQIEVYVYHIYYQVLDSGARINDKYEVGTVSLIR